SSFLSHRRRVFSLLLSLVVTGTMVFLISHRPWYGESTIDLQNTKGSSVLSILRADGSMVKRSYVQGRDTSFMKLSAVRLLRIESDPTQESQISIRTSSGTQEVRYRGMSPEF